MKRLRANCKAARAGVFSAVPRSCEMVVEGSALPAGASPLVMCAPGIALGVALTFAAALPLATRALDSIVDIVALAFLC